MQNEFCERVRDGFWCYMWFQPGCQTWPALVWGMGAMRSGCEVVLRFSWLVCVRSASVQFSG